MTCVDHEFSQHGKYAGYKLLSHFVANRHISKSLWFHKLLLPIPDKILFGFRPFHANWYDRNAFSLEFELLIEMIRSSSSVFHFLYGEHSTRYLGLLNRIFGNKNRIVATYHQLPSFFERRIEQFSHVKYLDAVILVGSNQRAVFEKIATSDKIHVIPHGVDTSFFVPGDELPGERKKYVQCITVGSNYRDFDTHIQVIQYLNGIVGSDIRFVVVGSKQYASYYENISNVKYLHGVSDNEMRRLYQDSDVLLLPLLDATACNALLEGMSCGLPIIITDVGGVRDYVDESCAILTPLQDAMEMSMELTQLLLDKQKRINIGRNARNRAVNWLDWKVVASDIQKIYLDLY